MRVRFSFDCVRRRSHRVYTRPIIARLLLLVRAHAAANRERWTILTRIMHRPLKGFIFCVVACFADLLRNLLLPWECAGSFGGNNATGFTARRALNASFVRNADFALVIQQALEQCPVRSASNLTLKQFFTFIAQVSCEMLNTIFWEAGNWICDNFFKK
jgi:hypothetical protein